MGKAGQYEIERRFLIQKPEADILLQGVTESIVQTYLLREGQRERVRKRGEEPNCRYTHTVKKRLTNLRRLETEREITKEEYEALLKLADPGRRVIEKQRCCIAYEGQTLEIDIFPFFSHCAILEIELKTENDPIRIPKWLHILREVTDDPRYTNASMAKQIPEER